MDVQNFTVVRLAFASLLAILLVAGGLVMYALSPSVASSCPDQHTNWSFTLLIVVIAIAALGYMYERVVRARTNDTKARASANRALPTSPQMRRVGQNSDRTYRH